MAFAVCAVGMLATGCSSCIGVSEQYVGALFVAAISGQMLCVIARRAVRSTARVWHYHRYAEDRRAPILLLRPFTPSDIVQEPTAEWMDEVGPHKWAGPLWSSSFGEGFWGVAPVIAVGTADADEDAASRRAEDYVLFLQIADARWRDDVARCCAAARLIVVQLGASPGIVEELKMLQGSPWLAKTVVLMPPKLQPQVHMWQFLSGDDIEVQWKHVQSMLREHGFEIPDYDPQGVVYVPDTTFGAARQRLLRAGETRPEHLKAPVEELVGRIDTPAGGEGVGALLRALSLDDAPGS